MIFALINHDYRNQRETYFLFFGMMICVYISTKVRNIIKYRSNVMLALPTQTG